MLLEETAAHKKLEKLFPNQNDQYFKVKSTFLKIERAVQAYMNSMVIISFITGALSYIALLILGVDFPILWAFLIFILNFIPYVGSFIATLLPATIAVFQYGNGMYFIYVLAVLMTIQMILGNFVQPKLMGKSLNISPIAVLLAFAFWGSIWGVTGMILSVPISSIVLIIRAQFPETRSIAIFMSENVDHRPPEPGSSQAQASLFFASSSMVIVAVAPHLVHPASRTAINWSRVRTPPAALTFTPSPTEAFISFR